MGGGEGKSSLCKKQYAAQVASLNEQFNVGVVEFVFAAIHFRTVSSTFIQFDKPVPV